MSNTLRHESGAYNNMETWSAFTGRDDSKDRGQTQERVRGRADHRLEAVAGRSDGQLLPGAVQPATAGCWSGGPGVEHVHVVEVQLLMNEMNKNFQLCI